MTEHEVELVLRAQDHTAAREAVTLAKADLRRAVVAAVHDGMTEVKAAKLAGVSRPTVRAWLGK